ncbi:serine/threonine-protein kinase [Streptosporangium sp. NPDC051022]|uniref:serine/threonine protein kinase n=1 Tax=Streptosporangium sp. NPDC051022 TaxID=3155752 RepID=UPI003416666C
MIPIDDNDLRQIGPYRIAGRLGTGGMGVVYAGLDPDGARVAVKLVHASLAGDPEFRARFAREISVLTRVRGVCTARILKSDADAARPWLAAEYVPGPTLDDYVRMNGALQGEQWFGLVAGLAEALVAIHAADVVHRDIKPSNVILSPSGPKLVDFGIARALDGTSVTHSGVLVGTPGWVSPEEYRSVSAGPAADVYGWGMLAVYAATGKPPYGTGRPEVLALKVLNDPVDTSAVPEPLRDLVDKALAKEPSSRPSAQEVLAEVSQAWRIGGVDELTTRLDRTWVLPIEDIPWLNRSGGSGRRTVMAAVAAAVVLGVAVAAVLRLLPDNAGPSMPPALAATTATSGPSESPKQALVPSASSNTSFAPSTVSASMPPSAPTQSELPRTTAELAAALDLALEITPAASFSFEGGFTQSDTTARATGRVVNRTSHTGRDDFDVQIVSGDDSKAHHVVYDGDLYPGGKELSDLDPATPEWAALMVAGTAGPSIIGEVVANSTRMERKGHTYSGTLAIDKTNGLLRNLFSSWMGGDVAETSPRSYLTYRLSIDSDSRPKKFSLVWCFPTGNSGIYRSEFTTTYSDWRSNSKVDKP